jgi:hypothetical protein
MHIYAKVVVLNFRVNSNASILEGAQKKPCLSLVASQTLATLVKLA